jgi:ABC-type multidrug transport system fused ATPase/permease subunit
MDQGLIVEQGTHQELIHREGGYYKNYTILKFQLLINE